VTNLQVAAFEANLGDVVSRDGHWADEARAAAPNVPGLGLDVLLSQLIDRAQDIRQAHERLRGLLSANRLIISNLTLASVLRHIVEAARDLVDARYAALGVIAPDGDSLESFIYAGMDEGVVDHIGPLPTGKGLLGALIDEPQPIRLNAIADDIRSAGFPAHHPVMNNFLGVPIRVRDSVFGNLYLTEANSGEFTEDDEEVVLALAATAGVAIENARLFEQADQRERWLQASVAITTQLLTGDGQEPLELIARQARHVADADIASVVLPKPSGNQLMVEVADADEPTDLTGYAFPAENTLSGQAIDTGRPVLLDDAVSGPVPLHLLEVMTVGPVMALPLVGMTGVRGSLVIGRRAGRPRFESADLDMATTFANHASVALELADARSREQQIALLEDRDRIARDLHDHVIQRLFAAGLTLDGLAGAVPPDAAVRIGGVINDIDETIRQIRTSIFELRGHLGPQLVSARSRVTEIVAEVTPLLPAAPRVRFVGAVDSLVPETVADELVAVVREGLTNVARHSSATTVELMLSATPTRVALDIVDDGVGVGESTRRSGLANLRQRAEKLGGTMTLEPRALDPSSAGNEGTHLRWTVPL
jgi:signal transduction histidine kinase